MARPATARGIPRRTGKEGFAPRLGRPTRSTPRPSSARAGASSTTARSTPAGAAGSTQDGFINNAAFAAPWAAWSRRSSSTAASRRTSARRPFIRSDFRNGQGICYRPLDANERPRSQQWNLTVDREIGHRLHGGRGLRGQPRPPAAVQQRPAQRARPELLCPWATQLNDEFQPGQTSLHGVPEPYPGWRRADDRLRALAGPGAAALSAVLRQPAGPQREPRRVASTTRCRRSSRSDSRTASTRSCRTRFARRSRQRLGQHPAGRAHVERRAGRDLAVRAGPQRRPGR